MTSGAPRRLRAPQTDGAWLTEPPPSEIPELLDANRRHLADSRIDLQGRSLARIRSMARREAIEGGRRFLRRFGLDDLDRTPDPEAPLIVTGHQPELFHPGVWVKNFAAGGIAAKLGGVAVNLIVDNDTPKTASIRVPFLDENGRLLARPVEYDAWGGEVPFEDLRVINESLYASFADRALGLLDGLIPDPLLAEDWPNALEIAKRTDHLGLRLALLRRRREAAWGLKNLEWPLSALCESEAFLWFVCHLIAHADRFLDVHNRELQRYRDRAKIRSRRHPVPDLQRERDWVEAPFWIWRASAPRRRSLMARQAAADRLELRIDGEDEPLLDLPLGPDREACCAVEWLRGLPALGVRLRTRALTTTMFARLVLGDLFLHGIGGARYDELGDHIFLGFFGEEPPAFQTWSMTLWPGLPDDPEATEDRLRTVEAELRDLTFNPDRHLIEPFPNAAAEAVAAKRRAIAGPTETRRQRIDRFFAIRRANEALAPFVADRRAELEARRDRLRAGLARNAIAHDRSFAAVLHQQDRLRTALDRAFSGSAPGPK